MHFLPVPKTMIGLKMKRCHENDSDEKSERLLASLYFYSMINPKMPPKMGTFLCSQIMHPDDMPSSQKIWYPTYS